MIGIYYLSRRLAWAYSFPLGWTMAVVTTFSLFCLVGIMMIMRGNYTSPLSHLISTVANIGAGVMMFLVFTMLVVDLVHLFAHFQPRTFGWVTLGVTSAVTLFSLWNAQHHTIYRLQIPLPNLVQPLRIAQLTDIHLGHYWTESTLDRIVDKVVAEQPDAVVITGDMFDGRVRLYPEVLRPLVKLTMPIYFVEGNHDGYSGAREIKQMLTDAGVTVLSNQKTELNGLQIVGLDYLLPDRQSVDQFHGAHSRTSMADELPKMRLDPNRASLLLHHNPVGIRYAAENGINLYLAGHTHAGQLFPATLFAKLMFEYNKGLYHYNDATQIYVSQGTGTFGPPMRLCTDSEITILDLVRSH